MRYNQKKSADAEQGGISLHYTEKTVEEIKIAYIGGGSRGWAWGLMSDLASCSDISGQVALYDIDLEAAKDNEIIGNLFRRAEGAASDWRYLAVRELKEALTRSEERRVGKECT